MRFAMSLDHIGLSTSGGETDAGPDCGGLVSIAIRDGGGHAVAALDADTATAFARAILRAAEAAREFAATTHQD